MTKEVFVNPDVRTPQGDVELFYQRTPEGYPAFSEVSRGIDQLVDHWIDLVDGGGVYETINSHAGFKLGIRVKGAMSRKDFRKLIASFTSEVRQLIERDLSSRP